MVKGLQKKFIRTTMLVVTILLIVFLAVMNTVNYVLSRRDSVSRLERIAERSAPAVPGDGGAGIGQNSVRPDERIRSMPAADSGNLGMYFTAQVSQDGAVTYSDLTHAGDLSWDEMISLLREADDAFSIEVSGETETEDIAPGRPGDDPETVPKGQGDPPEKPDGPQPDAQEPPDAGQKMPAKTVTGRAGNYLYTASQQKNGSVTWAFLDVSQERNALVRILLVTVVVGVAAWLLIFLLVIYLSRRAIAPIAENIERQRRFITDAGHELKTPLAVIVSNVDVQELHGGRTKWLDNIRSQAFRLSELTKQMLTLAKMDESGAESFVSTTFDASQVMEDTVRLFGESADLRHIRVRTDIEPSVQITFSKEQFRQMLELLLDNAVKYGRENGELSVSLHTDRKRIRMSFSNDCEHLPETEPDRLFDRFYRADTSRSRQTGGSGIGLAVVRAIAEHGGGKANAYYHGENVIEFVIELPKNKN